MATPAEPHSNNNVPLELLRAELKAAMADQMLVLVDRFAARRDLDELKKLIAENQKSTDDKFKVLFEHIQNNTVNEERSRQIADEAIEAKVSQDWTLKSGKATVIMGLTAVLSFIVSPIVAWLVAHYAYKS